jgi:hypothetical protein
VRADLTFGDSYRNMKVVLATLPFIVERRRKHAPRRLT